MRPFTCAVGRSTFELARHCAEVIGIDYSHRFVEVAAALAREGGVSYERTDEGSLTTPLVASVPSIIERKGVRFEHGHRMVALPLTVRRGETG